MSKDDHIAAVQEALAICGCYPGSYDGVMGPKTRGAIKEFQNSCGLTADGVCGPMTQSKIAEHLGEKVVRAQHLKGYFEGADSISAEDAL